ncbi:VOC family protein, partial [Frateuria sp.]|uniref:VOC family protein n=1 Tax=Frateuria sp. TaxID=2211372 RepID=UPI0025BDCA15
MREKLLPASALSIRRRPVRHGDGSPREAPYSSIHDEDIPMQVQPYLFFDGRCEEAVAFYRQALGAQVVMLMHYSDAPAAGAGCPGGTPAADKVMHACLQIGQSQVMASDGYAAGHPEFKGVSLSIAADDDAQARRFFDA